MALAVWLVLVTFELTIYSSQKNTGRNLLCVLYTLNNIDYLLLMLMRKKRREVAEMVLLMT